MQFLLKRVVTSKLNNVRLAIVKIALKLLRLKKSNVETHPIPAKRQACPFVTDAFVATASED